MIKSMTGYGRSVMTFEGREITVEIKSVNNRYLDCSVKLPRTLSYAEEEIKKKIKDAVSRGKIDVFVTVRENGGEETVVTLNRSVVESYIAAMKTMVSDYGVRDDISVSILSSLPDTFALERKEVDEEQVLNQVRQVLDEALAHYDEMRCREGSAMENDLLQRRDTILELVSAVEQRSPITVAEYRARLEDKIREVLENRSIDESRILTEAAVFADKIAVDEETVRLRSHFDQMTQMLKTGGAVGRKLDFLLQEMNREANTIGSKGNDLEQARHVVDIKAELEKIREQVQNIE